MFLVLCILVDNYKFIESDGWNVVGDHRQNECNNVDGDGCCWWEVDGLILVIMGVVGFGREQQK